MAPLSPPNNVSRRFAVLAASCFVGLRPLASRGESNYDAFAPTYDVLDGGQAAVELGFEALRRKAVARARGDVLEVGVGTGLNLPLYDWAGVRSFVAIDASAGMLDLARARAQQLGIADKARLQVGDVAELPFKASTFDVVIDTFSLCVFKDPAAAMREMRRVLKPAGLLVCVEHQRANGLLGAYQDISEPFVTPVSKGCVWNQDVRALARGAGFREVVVDEAVLGTVVALVLEAV